MAGRLRRGGTARDGSARKFPDTAPATPQPSSQRTTDAFATSVEPETPVLLRVAYTLTGSWPDAEDVVQETLIRAWRAMDSFDGAHPRAWLLTILRRAHLNSLRRRRPELLADDTRFERHRPAFGPSAARLTDDQVLERGFSAEVEQAVRSLKPTFRTVLLLVDVDQLTYAEAAETLGLPMGTVVSRLYRARSKVRRHLVPRQSVPREEPR